MQDTLLKIDSFCRLPVAFLMSLKDMNENLQDGEIFHITAKPPLSLVTKILEKPTSQWQYSITWAPTPDCSIGMLQLPIPHLRDREHGVVVATCRMLPRACNAIFWAIFANTTTNFVHLSRMIHVYCRWQLLGHSHRM